MPLTRVAALLLLAPAFLPLRGQTQTPGAAIVWFFAIVSVLPAKFENVANESSS